MTPHLLGGLGIGAGIALCFLGQLTPIRNHSHLVDEVMDAVKRARAARGLDTEAATT